MDFKPDLLYLMQEAEETPEIKRAIKDFAPTWLHHHKTSKNDLLYHYTTFDGMSGILQGQNIRFGHSTTFNDPNEILYGMDLIKNIIHEKVRNESNQETRDFLSNLVLQVNSLDTIGFDVFLACFCETDNLLSLWRTYSSQGGGFCLGLDFSEKTKMVKEASDLESEAYLCLRKVLYEKGLQESLVEDYISKLICAFQSVGLPSDGFERHTKTAMMGMQAANVLWDMVFSFKHSAFSEETEWRIVHVTQRSHQAEKVKFIRSGTYLNPYRSLYFFQIEDIRAVFPLRSITYGPSLHPPRIETSLGLLIKNLHANEGAIMSPASVRISGAGYRIRQ